MTASLLLAAHSAGLIAQDNGLSLSEAQIQQALAIEAGASAAQAKIPVAEIDPALQSLRSTAAGIAGKIVRPMVVPVESTRGEAREGGVNGRGAAAFAVVMRYDYRTAITTRTTIELATGRVIRVRHDALYPTPLDPSELDEAIALARRSVPAFDGVLRRAQPGELELAHMTPINKNPLSPRFGHRLVYLWTERPQLTDRILVDLSTNEVVTDPH